MTHPVCPRCDDLAPTPDALTCPTCAYWPLRVPTAQERADHQTRAPRTVNQQARAFTIGREP